MEENKKTKSPIPELGREIRRRESTFYSIVEYELGIVYHVYNSMDVVIRAGQTSAFNALSELLTLDSEENESLNEATKKGIESMFAVILNLPLVAFTDIEFCVKISKHITDFLNEKVSAIDDMELAEETEEDKEMNELYENAMLASDLLPKTKEELLGE